MVWHYRKLDHSTVFYTPLYYIRPCYNTWHSASLFFTKTAVPHQTILCYTTLHYYTRLCYKALGLPSLIYFARTMWSSGCLPKAVVAVSAFSWHVHGTPSHTDFPALGEPQHRQTQAGHAANLQYTVWTGWWPYSLQMQSSILSV